MWHDIFNLQLTVGDKVLRALLIYVFLVRRALRSSGISLSELRAIARRQGFADLGEVHTAILETNGVVTMFRADEPELYHPAAPAGEDRRAA